MDFKAALKITANVAGQQEVDRLARSMVALEGTVGSLTRVMGALGLAFTAQQFGSWVKGSIDFADSLNDLRQQTGIAVEDLNALALAAEQNGTSLEAVAGGVAKLSKTLSSAAGGNKEAIKSLSGFGISLSDIQGGSLGALDALTRISDRVSEMPDGLRKTAELQKVFGKSAAGLVPFLNAGGDAIRNARDELAKYGGLISGDFAASADEFNDKMATLGFVARGYATTLAKVAVPALSALSEGILTAISNADDMSNDDGLETWARETALAIASLIDGLSLGAKAITHIGFTAQSVFADMQYIKAWLTTPWGDRGPGSELQKMWEERAAAMDAVRKSLGELQSFDTQRFFKATQDAFDRQRSAPGKTDLGGKTLGDGGFDVIDPNAETEAAAAAKKRAELLKTQANTINDYVLSQQESIDLLKLEAKQVGMSAFDYRQLTDAKRQEYDVARATNDMLPETAARYKEVAAALFATKQEVEKLNYEQSRTFAVGAKQALSEYAENAGNAAEQVSGVVSDAFSGMEDALVEFVKTGKLDFASLIDSMIADLARLAIKQAILGPLAQAIGGAISITPNANGGVMTSSGPVPLRAYAGGGIARSPQMALFGEGSMPEAYVPLPDGRSIPVNMRGGGSNVQVVVNNNSGQQVTTNETSDGRGNRRIEVQVGEMIASEIRRAGSPANMAIRQSFRTNQNLTGR